jgi:D-glycerate 3-kinase
MYRIANLVVTIKMPFIDDDLRAQARKVLAFLAPVLNRQKLSRHQHLDPVARNGAHDSQQCIMIGLTGLQGSGKSTWAMTLVEVLRQEYTLNAITVSLDDFYRTHEELVQLRKNSPANKLLLTRGQPGTHDERLAIDFFEVIRTWDGSSNDYANEVRVPSFDKSCHNGEGDRAPESSWQQISSPVDVIVFEGWCVGFRPLPRESILSKHEASVAARQAASVVKETDRRMATDTLADHDVEHLTVLNDALNRYCDRFMGPEHFDCLVHLDTRSLKTVYAWRLDQEEALKKRTGCGMSEEEVLRFVRGYMPGYELYLSNLRKGFFTEPEHRGKIQVQVMMDHTRKVLGSKLV